MSYTHGLLATLRTELRRHGWTNRTLAAALAVGEATVKRWLIGKGLQLARLEQLAGLCSLTLGELIRQADEPQSGLAGELTLAQERALSRDEFLSFLFITLLGGYGCDEVARDFDLPASQMEAALERLQRLALIDRFPGGRVRPRIQRSVIWRKLPMRSMFEQRMKAQFMAMDFAAEDSVYASELLKLSAQGAAMLAEMIEQHRRDVQALAEQDRTRSHLPRSWYAMLCAARPLDTSGLVRG